MTQHKVIAEDSLSAMDEITKVLGKEAVILKTQKVNGKIEILGSNNIEDIASSNAKKIQKQKSNFSHLFSNQRLENDNQSRKFNNIINKKNAQNHLNFENHSTDSKEKFDTKFVDIETFSKFTDKIENLLKNMVISDIDGFNSNNKKSLTIELLQQGFSKNVVSEFVEKIDNNEANSKLLFYHYMSNKLVTSYEEKILNSDIIFINGSSGSGKTTLCSKISSYILDNVLSANEKDKLSIMNFAPKSSTHTELVNFGRMLNINVASASSLNQMISYIEENKGKIKMIIDVSDENNNLSSYLEYLEKITLNKNCLNLLAIPASSNKTMIKTIMSFYKNSYPTVGLTKLDESHISAEELSILAELNCKIGVLSGSRSIIGSLAFAKKEVLAQYMKDINK